MDVGQKAVDKLKPVQLSALSRLFSSAVFHEMAKCGRSNLFIRLLQQTGIQENRVDSTVGDMFDAAFSVLKCAGHRDEYVYRAALIHNILLGKHSLKTASALNEFRVGCCKADLVILNGTATVYEIKSERDTLMRLKNQIVNYSKVFAEINVIASESHTREIMGQVPNTVGIMCLTARGHIRTLREAKKSLEFLCPVAIFESLRSAEAKALLKKLDIEVPEVSNIMLRSALRERFRKLDPEQAHCHMVQILKRSRSSSSLEAVSKELPRSLRPALISAQIRASQQARVIAAVNTPIASARLWGDC